ncbi:MAG: ATP-binding protein [Opitutales bacterium]
MQGSGKKGKLLRLLKLNKRLADEVLEFQTIFNSLEESVIVFNKEGKISFANNSSKKLLGIPEIYENYPLYKLIPSLELDIENFQGRVLRREFQVSYPEDRYLKSYLLSFKQSEATFEYEKLWVIILSDTTKERIVAEELIENEKINSILDLASGIAHEIGNPLNSMSIHLQLVKRSLAKIDDEKLRGQIENSIEICKSETKRLDGIVKNFLKAIRPQKAILVEMNAISPLMEVLKTLEIQLSKQEISINIQSENIPPAILGDFTLLQQLYFNIIKNAIEAIGSKGNIDIKITSDDEFLNLAFIDNGCGMSQENISRIFEPYYTNKEEGNGLGMMLIENIVKSHNGKIALESQEGIGTMLTISLRRSSPVLKRLA